MSEHSPSHSRKRSAHRPGGEWKREIHNDSEGNELIEYQGDGLVLIKKAGTVSMLEIGDREYATARGSKVGDTVAQLNKPYPE